MEGGGGEREWEQGWESVLSSRGTELGGDEDCTRTLLVRREGVGVGREGKVRSVDVDGDGAQADFRLMLRLIFG